ncbi:MAG: HAMP domain-containing protein, partial [Veillonella sp.]|nr:HAMP domain-containing protein [Veillonella sp.]
MLQRLQTMGLTSRLTAMVVSVVIVFSVAVSVLMWQVVSSVMEEDLHNRGIGIANDLVQSVKNPIQTGNLPALDELIHNVKSANAIIEYIFITDDTGKVMVYTFDDGMPQGLLVAHPPVPSPDTVYLNTDRGRIQDVSMPVEDGSLGYIRMGINDQELVGLWRSNMKKLVGLTILVILIGSFIAYRLTRHSVAPLRLLMKRAEHIAGGVYDEPAVKVLSHDEIGRLTEAMNTMQQSLKQSTEERRRLIEYLISIQENERKRISMELHD